MISIAAPTQLSLSHKLRGNIHASYDMLHTQLAVSYFKILQHSMASCLLFLPSSQTIPLSTLYVETENYFAAGMDTNASCSIAQPPCRHDWAIVTKGNSVSNRQQCKHDDQVKRLHSQQMCKHIILYMLAHPPYSISPSTSLLALLAGYMTSIDCAAYSC